MCLCTLSDSPFFTYSAAFDPDCVNATSEGLCQGCVASCPVPQNMEFCFSPCFAVFWIRFFKLSDYFGAEIPIAKVMALFALLVALLRFDASGANPCEDRTPVNIYRSCKVCKGVIVALSVAGHGTASSYTVSNRADGSRIA